MNTVLNAVKRIALCLAIACLAMIATPNASAVRNSELLRVEQNQTLQGVCCFSWLEKVHVSEPTTVAPVVVTFSTDYQATADFFVGLSVNGGPCIFFGSGTVLKFGAGDGSGAFNSRYFQWLILPKDGLVTGSNAFTLCGGSATDPTGVILLGFNTLAVRISE